MGKDKDKKSSNQSFFRGRYEFQKSLIKSMRIGISILIIIYSVTILPFFGQFNLIFYVGAPGFFIFQLLTSTIVLRKKYEHLCPYYITVMILALIIMSLEATETLDKENFNGVILGMEISVFYSIFLVYQRIIMTV